MLADLAIGQATRANAHSNKGNEETEARAASTPHISKSVSQMPSKPSRSMACASSTTVIPTCTHQRD